MQMAINHVGRTTDAALLVGGHFACVAVVRNASHKLLLIIYAFHQN